MSGPYKTIWHMRNIKIVLEPIKRPPRVARVEVARQSAIARPRARVRRFAFDPPRGVPSPAPRRVPDTARTARAARTPRSPRARSLELAVRRPLRWRSHGHANTQEAGTTRRWDTLISWCTRASTGRRHETYRYPRQAPPRVDVTAADRPPESRFSVRGTSTQRHRPHESRATDVPQHES